MDKNLNLSYPGYPWESGGQKEHTELDLIGCGCNHKVLRVLEVKNLTKIDNFRANLAASLGF